MTDVGLLEFIGHAHPPNHLILTQAQALADYKQLLA
jgi:hypothetical protein